MLKGRISDCRHSSSISKLFHQHYADTHNISIAKVKLTFLSPIKFQVLNDAISLIHLRTTISITLGLGL